METRTLGRTDLEITRVGVGTAPIGSVPGLWWVNWGHQDERDSMRAIHTAVDGGINWIDTAPFYGWGRAEEIVGCALHDHGDVLVFTKCGTMRRADGDDYMDLHPQTVRADLEQSLRRLRRQAVDLLQLHDVDRTMPIEETWGAVQDLIAEGKVRHGGISNPTSSSARCASGPSLRCSSSTAHCSAGRRSGCCRSRRSTPSA